MRPARSWWLVLILSAAVALYALAVVLLRERMYPPHLAPSFLAHPWGIGLHAGFGSIALALGPLQFHRRVLAARRPLHRALGRVYVIACLVSGLAGLFLAQFAFGGPGARWGFGLLAVALVVATSRALRSIRRRDVATHREWMLRSYSLIFAAVALRIELPFLVLAFGDLVPAYGAAWLCWVPNLLWAEAYIRRTRPGQQRG